MQRRTSLVCQYLEHVSWRVLQDYQEIIRLYIRKRHGVYALYRKDKLYYVGLANNLRGRLKQHLRDRHSGLWDHFSIYLTIGDRHIRELESLLLRIVRPAGNKQVGRFGRAESLRKQFANEIRQQERDRLAMLGLAVPKRKTLVKKLLAMQGVMARYLNGRRLRLKGWHKGQTRRALVMRDGRIRFKNRLYGSPSLAAAAARNTPTCNGWWFWHYQRGPGEWVRLRELRG
jgi:Restriction Enzyme Adenine Methylase Associated/GIY-YIG catalytic domain